MKLFMDGTLREYLSCKKSELEEEIKKLSDDQIYNTDLKEWIDYYFYKYEIIPLTFYMENITSGIEECKVKKYNNFRVLDESEYYSVDGYKIIFKIPFDGTSELLKYQPSTFSLSSFPVEKIISPCNEDTGYLVYVVEYTRSEMKNMLNAKKEVDTSFRSVFNTYLDMIKHINSDIDSYNYDLKNRIEKNLLNRKKKADDFSSICNALEIPMKLSENAPNMKLISLKRITRKPLKKLNKEIQKYNIQYLIQIMKT